MLRWYRASVADFDAERKTCFLSTFFNLLSLNVRHVNGHVSDVCFSIPHCHIGHNRVDLGAGFAHSRLVLPPYKPCPSQLPDSQFTFPSPSTGHLYANYCV